MMVIAIAALPVHPPLMARSVTVKVPATTAVFVTYPIVAALLIANAAQSWAVTSQTIGNHHQGLLVEILQFADFCPVLPLALLAGVISDRVVSDDFVSQSIWRSFTTGQTPCVQYRIPNSAMKWASACLAWHSVTSALYHSCGSKS